MPRLIRLPFRDKDLLFIFGPYRERVRGTYGVKLAPEVEGQADLLISIPDFGVPGQAEYQIALARLILLADEGHVVYVGCRGGIGRTGMVLAGLRRVLCKRGADDCITWGRANYHPHAVETRAQENLIRDFDVAAVRNAVRLQKPVAASCIRQYIKRIFGNARRQADDTSRI